MKLVVIGTGYVGLVSGTCFADMGHKVVCLDIDRKKIDALNNGEVPIYEPGLEAMVQSNVNAGRLSFCTDYSEAIPGAEACFIAVDTPPLPDGSCDLSRVMNASRSIAEHMDGYLIVADKSTVPVGTAHHVRTTIAETLAGRGVEFEFDVVSNPEFLKEGDAINDCLRPDRIIIGSDSERATGVMKKLYAPFMRSHERTIVMDVISAELTKYASNAMLATRISFMNELAGFCDRVGADIGAVRRGMGSDPRIGRYFLYAGCGYGGSCFPKDVRALQMSGLKNDFPMRLVTAVDLVNSDQKLVLGEKLHAHFGSLEGKTVALFGLSFKPETDDMREATSLELIKQLVSANAKIRVYDPVAMSNARNLVPEQADIHWAENEYDAAQGADAVVLVTEWRQFRFLDFSALLKAMRGNVFVDGRNQYEPAEMAARGFDYISIGRPPVWADSAFDEAERVPVRTPKYQ